MVALAYWIAWGLLLGTALGYATVAARITRAEEFPGRPSFLATAVITALFLAVFTGMAILTHMDVGRGFQALGLVLTFGAGLTIPLVWIRFALQYTGQRFPTGRRTFLLLGIPIALTLLVVIGTLVLSFLMFGAGLLELPQHTMTLILALNSYSVAVTAFYLAALLIVGGSLIVWTSYSFSHLSNRGGVLLAVGFILPWFGFVMPEVANLFANQQLIRTYHAASAAILGLGSVWLAITRYDFFGSVPAAGTVGRDVTVEEMNDPVVVTDGAGRIIDLNPATERAFHASVDAIGTPLTGVFDAEFGLEHLLSDRAEGAEVTHQGRIFEPTSSTLQDEYGRLLGHSFVFHDVTDRKRREQRIQVLNRVLRHNLRNDMNAVNGYAELLEDQPADPGEYARQIQDVATRLISIGEKAREIEELFSARQAPRESDLRTVIDSAVEELRETHGDCEISANIDGGEMQVNGPVLTAVVRELLDNACRHNDAANPAVTVETTATPGDEALSIQVRDNGPGIPDHELTPLEEGAETELEHGSGLGLWLVDWGVTMLNGNVEFEADDPRGTVATVRLRSVH